MEISQETIATVLQLGTQYAIPSAALLRAIYHGWRGKLPEGLREIGLASLLAGLTAVADNQQPDLLRILLEIMSNTAFMAGLLSFILLYLLRQPDRGKWFDGFVGGVLGLIAWAVWVFLLGNDWSVWTFPLGIMAGAAAFIALRFSLRQLIRLMKVATWLLVAGVVFAIGAGGLYLLQLLINQAPPPAG